MRFREQARAYVRGQTLTTVHPAIVLFHRCSQMKWNHLPRAGGIPDQDPELWEMFDVIWSEQAKEEKRKADEQQKKQASKPNSLRKSSGGRRRR